MARIKRKEERKEGRGERKKIKAKEIKERGRGGPAFFIPARYRLEADRQTQRN